MSEHPQKRLIVRRSGHRRGIVRPRFKTHQGNKGNDAFKELSRLEAQWRKERMAQGLPI
jgi:hypothetical protein